MRLLRICRPLYGVGWPARQRVESVAPGHVERTQAALDNSDSPQQFPGYESQSATPRGPCGVDAEAI